MTTNDHPGGIETVPVQVARTAAAQPSRRERIVAALQAVEGVHLRQAERWCAQPASSHKDLDVWCAPRRYPDVAVALHAAGLRAADSTARTARWCGLWDDTVAVVDVAIGTADAGVFPIVSADTRTAAAVAVDELWRPLSAGRVPAEECVERARQAWQDAPGPERRDAVEALPYRVRNAVSRATETPTPELLAAAATKLSRAAKWQSALVLRRQRRLAHAVRLLAARAARPGRGQLVVIVGVDGSGKSTLVAETVGRLNSAGTAAQAVYFGSVRENAAPVAWLRRRFTPSSAGTSGGGPRGARPLTIKRRIVLALLAADGIWRYWTRVAPKLRQGTTVVADRWVCDLALEPSPGWPALATLTGRLVGAPQVAVHADPPPEVIAARSAESPLARARAAQVIYRTWVERQRQARIVRADTSGADADPAAGVLAAVVAAAASPVDAAHR